MTSELRVESNLRVKFKINCIHVLDKIPFDLTHCHEAVSDSAV